MSALDVDAIAPRKIHLLRHTTPDIARGVCYGQSDIPLAPSFNDEAADILKKLSTARYSIVYTSPLLRCQSLANLLDADRVVTDKRIQELSFGDWELCLWDEIERQRLDWWMDDFVERAPPNGESLLQMQKRVYGFIDDLLSTSSTPEQTQTAVAVVTHAGVIRLIAAWILDIPLRNLFRFGVDYGAIFELTLHPDRNHCQIKVYP